MELEVAADLSVQKDTWLHKAAHSHILLATQVMALEGLTMANCHAAHHLA